MAGVNVPPKKDKYGQLFQIGGAVIGGATAGPGGAFAGSMAGAQAGSMASGMLGGNAGAPQGVQNQGTAINRRIETYQPTPVEDPGADLIAAQNALRQLPPAMQQRYGSTIDQARQADARARGLA